MLQAAVAAGATLVGGLLGNKENAKAANTAFRYRVDLNTQAFNQQQVLLSTQNDEVRRLNDRVDAYNRDVLTNHNKNTTTQTDETSSSGSIDFQRLVKDAEAAGFNPLTVLRAGGMAGYSASNVKTTSTLQQTVARDIMSYFAPSQAPQAQYPGEAPIPQVTNAWGDAIQTGLNVWMKGNADKQAAVRQNLEQELTRAQIANLQSDTAVNRYRLTPPSYTASGTRATSGGFKGAVAGVLGAPSTPTVGETKITAPTRYLEVNPNFIDAAATEERHGEVLANVAGGINLAADIYQNAPAAWNWYKGHVSNATDYLKSTYGALVRSWSN